MLKKYQIALMGYASLPHTNYWPWLRFYDVFKELGCDVVWSSIDDLESTQKPRIFITWNDPDSVDIISSKHFDKSRDVIIQKLVGGSPRFSKKKTGSFGYKWTESYEVAKNFFLTHDFPDYKMVVDLLNDGYNIFSFGCLTHNKISPIKKKYCKILGDRDFKIPWGSGVYSLQEIKEAEPIINKFKFDVGYVGMFWQGNIKNINTFLKPIIKAAPSNKVYLAGKGTPGNIISNKEHKKRLKQSAICPVINANSWRVLGGVQDRFWTVFTSGRFGVSDSDGVYEFFNKDEVVCEINPEEYVQKSIYYMKNPEKQRPYIEKALKRIKEEYNYYKTWENIFKKLEKIL